MAATDARLTMTESWPWEAVESIFSLGIAEKNVVEKRGVRRSSYAVKARVALEGTLNGPGVGYTHSISPAGVGFVMDRGLDVGARGTICLAAPDGKEVRVEMRIRRCRRLMSGWFEISAEFQREVAEFEEFNFAQ